MPMVSEGQITVPAGQTFAVTVCLTPTGTLPAAGTPEAFSVLVTSTTNPALTSTANESFVMPQVDGVTLALSPTALSTTPGAAVTATLTVAAVGNEPEDVTLSDTTDTGLSLSGLSSQTIAAGSSATETLTLTPDAATALGTYLNGSITASFGPAGATQTQSLPFDVLVAAPGVAALASAAIAAGTLGNTNLASQTRRPQHGADQPRPEPGRMRSTRARPLASLTAVNGLLAADPDLSVAGPRADRRRRARWRRPSTPSQIQAAVTALGNDLDTVGTTLADEAAHGFTLRLRGQQQPDRSAPDRPPPSRSSLQNTGSQTTTYDLSLSGLPAGVTGTLSQSSITLAPGQDTSGSTGVPGADRHAHLDLHHRARPLQLHGHRHGRGRLRDHPVDHRLAHRAEHLRPGHRRHHQPPLHQPRRPGRRHRADPQRRQHAAAGDGLVHGDRLERRRPLHVATRRDDPERPDHPEHRRPGQPRHHRLCPRPGHHHRDRRRRLRHSDPGRDRHGDAPDRHARHRDAFDHPDLASAGQRHVTTTLQINSQTSLPAPLALAGQTAVSGASGVATDGTLAYVGTSAGIDVVDISDPTSPNVLSTFGASDLAGLGVIAMQVYNNELVVLAQPSSGGPSTLLIYSLATPTPRRSSARPRSSTSRTRATTSRGSRSRTTMSTRPRTIPEFFTSSGQIFEQYGESLDVDISNPAAPTVDGVIYNDPPDPSNFFPDGHNFWQVAAVNSNVLLIGTTTATGTDVGSDVNGVVMVVDTSNPANPTVLETLTIPGMGVVTGISVQGNQAFVIGSTETFQSGYSGLGGNIVTATLDLSNPQSPTVVSTQTLNVPSTGSSELDSLGNNLFVTDSLAGANGNARVLVFNDSDPQDVVVNQISVPNNISDSSFTVAGNLLLTADGTNLSIYNIGPTPGHTGRRPGHGPDR